MTKDLKITPASNLRSSSSSEDEDVALPFPTALPRSDFLAKDFQPAEYLSSLPQRHQTLEDLRAELRERSSAISAELLELVNDNYTVFLSLGDELKGGNERVEDVKVALLGFRRAVEEVKSGVSTRRQDVETLNEDLGAVRSDIEVGRSMLELDERLSDLEHRLAVGANSSEQEQQKNYPFVDSSDDEEDDDSDDDDADPFVGSSPFKLASFVRDIALLERLADWIGGETPFVAQAEKRIQKCRDTILIDLGNALKEAKAAGPHGQERVLKYLGLYRNLGAAQDAIAALKGSK